MSSPNDSVHFAKPLSPDDMLREQTEGARSQPLGEKLLAGIELFNLSCEFMRAGIRIQNPDATDEQIFAIIEQRLALARRMENRA